MTAAPAALVDLFEAAGFPRAAAPLLHPADVFVEFSGEDIRRRLFLTQDAAGTELCLRPEFTIPVSRAYLASKARGKPQNFSYEGPVFRQRPGESGEFIQAGIESFGRADREAADAEMADLALQAAEKLGARNAALRIGDIALLNAVLAALKFPAGGARRIKRALAAGKNPDEAIAGASAQASSSAGEFAGLSRAVDGMERDAARALVEDTIAAAGAAGHGGRSAAEIAERFVDQARERKLAVTGEASAALKQFLSLSGEPDQVSAAARKIARAAKLDIEQELDSFDARTGFMAARGLDVSALKAETAFARSLDYYTGFVFELPGSGAKKPLIGGGRYDSLLRRLGAEKDIPATGFAVWVERFGAAG